jgi:outer membrane protein assembly factor BamB
VDDTGRVLRLGPGGGRSAGVDELAPRWLTAITEDPFTAELLRSSPVVDGDRAYIISGANQLLHLEPGTGALDEIGDLELGDAVVVLPSPVGDGAVHVTAQEQVGAFDLRTGATRWLATAPGLALQPGVLAGSSFVVPTSDDGRFHVSVFDAATGALRWTARTGRAVVDAVSTGVAVSGDLVIGGDPVRGRDLGTGEEVWTARVGGTIGPVAVDPAGERVIVPVGEFDEGEEGFLVALDVATGRTLWRASTGAMITDPLSDILIGDTGGGDRIVVTLGADRRTVLGTDTRSGEERWRRELPASRLGQGALLDDLVWLPLVDGRVVALDPASGDTVARSADLGIDLEEGALAQRPALVDGTLVVTAGLALVGVSTTGGGG